MTFGTAIRTVFGNLTKVSGRSRRAEFWWFYLFISLAGIPFSVALVVLELAMVAPVLSTMNENGDLASGDVSRFVGTIALVVGLSLVLGLVSFSLTFAVWVRRLHDVGQSAHWLWFSLAGLGIVPLVMVMMEGEPHENQYGPDPKAAERAALGGWTQPPPAPPAHPASPVPPAPPT